MQIEGSAASLLVPDGEPASRPASGTAISLVALSPSAREASQEVIKLTPRTAPEDIIDIPGLELNQSPPEQGEDSSLRNMTPRDMTEYSMDLYLSGALSFEEYSMLAFQPELHPDYEKTIGALTGERAQPDKPRDYISQWEDRLDFEHRYPGATGEMAGKVERILNVLKSEEAPTDTIV